MLAEYGSAHLLANWIMPADGDWQERVAGWVAGRGCDAWIWQREVADPAEYVTLWLRDAGLAPGSAEWGERYDAWLDWFARAGVVAVGMGFVSLWRSGAADPVFVAEDVPQAVEQPVGAELPAWIGRQRWLAATDDDALLHAALEAAPDLIRERSDVLGEPGWQEAAARLRQSHGLRWERGRRRTDRRGGRRLRRAASALSAGLERPRGRARAADRGDRRRGPAGGARPRGPGLPAPAGRPADAPR